MAIAANPKNHNHICVANGGKINGVACYVMSKTGLQPMNNTVRSLGLNQTTPPAGPAGTVSDILFTEDGKTLLVSVKGAPPTPGFVAQFAVGKGGALSSNFDALSATAGGLVRSAFLPNIAENTNGCLISKAIRHEPHPRPERHHRD